mgnify:CR=1 FL=1
MYDEALRRLPARRYPEDALQKSIVQYLDWALPPDAVVFAVPNGGKRHAREAARLRGVGVKAGVPDLCLVWRGRALFLEVKAIRGVLAHEQRAMIHKLEYCGALVWVVRSVEQVELVLRDAGVLLRGSVNDNQRQAAAVA